MNASVPVTDLVATATRVDGVRYDAANGDNKAHHLARLGLDELAVAPGLSPADRALIAPDARSAKDASLAGRDPVGFVASEVPAQAQVPTKTVATTRPTVVRHTTGGPKGLVT